MTRALVMGIERDLHRARVRFGEEPADEYVSYSVEPVPMGDAEMVRLENGRWHCLGPLVGRRNLLRDHFLSANVTGQDPWSFSTIFAGTFAPGPSLGLGVGRLRAPGFDSAVIDKDNGGMELPDAPGAVHGVARIAAGDLMTETFCAMSVTVANIAVAHDPSLFGTVPTSAGNWGFIVSDDSGTQTVLSGTPVTADEFIWVDLLALGDGFCAGWINGDGPYAIENLLASTAFEISAANVNTQSGTRDFLLDLIAAYEVSPVRDPAQYALGIGGFAGVT